MSQLRMPVLVAVLLSCVMACGDDDDDVNGTGGSTAPARDAGPVADGGGLGPSEAGDEGWPCASQNECLTGFKCIKNIFTIGVCARACTDASTCKTDEACFSYTTDAADQHCVNIVTDEYDVCGVGVTALCKDRSCLYFPNLPIGVCVDVCALDGSGVAIGDDAGAMSGGDSLVMCRSGESCIDGVIADPRGTEGVCGSEVTRGQECGIESGRYCAAGDKCAPENPNDPDSKLRCFQDCSSGNSCDKGACTVVAGMVAYCL